MRLTRAIFGFSLCLILAACSKSGAQLKELKALGMCEGKTIEQFLESESIEHEWFAKDGNVGFVATFENYKGDAPFKYGFTAKPVQNQSTTSDRDWNFQPLRLDIARDGEEYWFDGIAVNMKLENLCSTYKKLTKQELAQLREKEAAEKAEKIEQLNQSMQEDKDAIEEVKKEIAPLEAEAAKLREQLPTSRDKYLLDSQIRDYEYQIESKNMKIDRLTEKLNSKQQEIDSLK